MPDDGAAFAPEAGADIVNATPILPAAPTQAVVSRATRRPRKPPVQKPAEGALSRRWALEHRGLESIPDRELLAHLVGMAVGEEVADDMAARLIRSQGSLTNLVAAPAGALRELGVPARLSVSLRLVWEMAARLAREEMIDSPRLSSAAQVLAYARVRLARETTDQVRVVYLDVSQQWVADELHQAGTIGSVGCYPREILRRALVLEATSIVVMRGQAMRKARMLSEDKSNAKALERAGEALGVRLVDYLVIGRDSEVSYRAVTGR